MSQLCQYGGQEVRHKVANTVLLHSTPISPVVEGYRVAAAPPSRCRHDPILSRLPAGGYEETQHCKAQQEIWHVRQQLRTV